jgi:hypothetical protein
MYPGFCLIAVSQEDVTIIEGKCRYYCASGYILRVSISLLSVPSFNLEVKSPWAYLELEKLSK